MRIFLVGLVLLFIGFGQLNATEYYVDFVGGSDANAGSSSAAPWKHCPGDPAATDRAAGASLAAGDVVRFKGGVTYVLSGAIALNWNGVPNNPIVYDGNSTGKWGVGRARLTDNYGAGAITAFKATTLARGLQFRSLEFAGIGGAPSVPADPSAALTPRYGGGIAFDGGCDAVTIDSCVFRELGYWFNQKPMSAESIRGVAISTQGASSLKITKCEFARMEIGCDFSAGAYSSVQIVNCAFGESLVWPINLPNASAADVSQINDNSTYVEDNYFGSAWQGYGNDPRTPSATVDAGATVTFNATASASPTATFQWRRNGLNIAGASGPTFELRNVSAADAGVYTAVATNAGGSTLSNSAVVIVRGASATTYAAPTISREPSDLAVPAQGSALFSVAATGTPAPSYQWLKNGVPIPGETSALLSLAGVTASAAYAVVVSNAAGSVTSRSAKLSLIESGTVAPTFTTQPASQVGVSGSSVTFYAAASGSPAPTFQWLKNGTAITGATASSLTLNGLSAADAGVFAAVAMNSAGTASSSDATLTVATAPYFTQHPIGTTVGAGSAVTFSVSAQGAPAPTFQWRKDGVDIPGATAATLRFGAVSQSNVGTYTVTAKNAAGTAVSAEAWLGVVDTYAPPPTTATPPPPTTTTDSVGGIALRVNSLVTLEPYGKRVITFDIAGSSPKNILVRAMGPTLRSFGATDALNDPRIVVSGQTVIGQNDDWGGIWVLLNATSQAGATPFYAGDSKDAALLATVAPGSYSVTVSASDGGGGTVLVEVYEFP
jgi:hypothetical protein